ncbi:hypothetical protein [Xanthomonas albilineans]|uniref:Uncharacterized protein n=1 Tax=Xanthomonas albilineans (strain GPE PC73 / CFBP 7063) TaxID=380358 RepID=D2UAM5_XANAP|nr:hypothetical protein [Xanthomonas albilineans]CBA14782.1 hypothetical protein XALC_0237 [Xanthomonas albilineans GPE PC73]
MTISTRKQSAAFAAAGVHNMPRTRSHIWTNVVASVPEAVLSSMTSRQLAAVIAAAHKSYHDGRATNQAEVIDDAIWIGAGVDRLLPLAALKSITEDHSREPIEWSKSGDTWAVIRYRMDYNERV